MVSKNSVFRSHSRVQADAEIVETNEMYSVGDIGRARKRLLARLILYKLDLESSACQHIQQSWDPCWHHDSPPKTSPCL